ncbi:MAG: molybdopterin-dependent oxidoreductase, partial [Firmicutes bacterium]|nr:molybdopterin-dependent oxidoreductase [Bacillota bacterium]
MSIHRKVRTACPLDCFDTCGMVAHVTDGRVSALEGDPDHPITRGFICQKGKAFAARASSPYRITRPMVRDAHGWHTVSWGEALDRAATALECARSVHGSLSVFYNWDFGSMGLLKQLDLRFWNVFGGVTLPRGSLCSSAGIAGLIKHYGSYSCHDPEDIP